MPRARISDASEDVVLPKPRARKPRAISADAASAPAPRKRAAPRARTSVVRVSDEREEESVVRKAPTPIAARKRTQSRNSKTILSVLGVCVLIAGVGIGVGFMDSGSIDVVAVVNERNEKINKGEVRDELGNAVTQTIQVQSDSRPNGGLPLGEEVAPPPVPEVVATTTASTTPEIASSTESTEVVATTTEAQ